MRSVDARFIALAASVHVDGVYIESVVLHSTMPTWHLAKIKTELYAPELPAEMDDVQCGEFTHGYKHLTPSNSHAKSFTLALCLALGSCRLTSLSDPVKATHTFCAFP